MAEGDMDTAQTTGGLSKDEKTWGMLAHLSGLALVLSIPAANVIAPLVVWLLKRNEMPFVDQEGKEALNFQITVLIAIFCCVPLYFLCGIGIFLLVAVAIGDIVLTIMAALKANEGVAYRYPFALRLIK